MYHRITPAEEEAMRRSCEAQVRQSCPTLEQMIAERAKAGLSNTSYALSQDDLDALADGKSLTLRIVNPIAPGAIVPYGPNGVVRLLLMPPRKPVPAPAVSYLWGADVAREMGAEA